MEPQEIARRLRPLCSGYTKMPALATVKRNILQHIRPDIYRTIFRFLVVGRLLSWGSEQIRNCVRVMLARGLFPDFFGRG